MWGVGEARADLVIKFIPSHSQMIWDKNFQVHVNSHHTIFSVDFDAQLSIPNDLILKCFQLRKVRRTSCLSPPKRILWFEVFMHDLWTKFSKGVKNVHELNEKNMCCDQTFEAQLCIVDYLILRIVQLRIVAFSSNLSLPKRILWFDVFFLKLFTFL